MAGAMSGGTHLTLEERERLAALKAEGLGLRAIAARLGRAASTVSRELRRNALPKGGYLPVHAEGCYLERRQRSAVLERDGGSGASCASACSRAGRRSRSPAG
jgi:IS30 family transposase